MPLAGVTSPVQYHPQQSPHRLNNPSQADTKDTNQDQGFENPLSDYQKAQNNQGQEQAGSTHENSPKRQRLGQCPNFTLPLASLQDPALARFHGFEKVFETLHKACTIPDPLFLLFHQVYYLWVSGDSALRTIVCQMLHFVPAEILHKTFCLFSHSSTFCNYEDGVKACGLLNWVCGFPYHIPPLEYQPSQVQISTWLIVELTNFFYLFNNRWQSQVLVCRSLPLSAHEIFNYFRCDSECLCIEIFKLSCLHVMSVLNSHEEEQLVKIHFADVAMESGIKKGLWSDAVRRGMLTTFMDCIKEIRLRRVENSAQQSVLQQPDSNQEASSLPPNPPLNSGASTDMAQQPPLQSPDTNARHYLSFAQPLSPPLEEPILVLDEEPILPEDPIHLPDNAESSSNPLNSGKPLYTETESLSPPQESAQGSMIHMAHDTSYPKPPEVYDSKPQAYHFISGLVLGPRLLCGSPNVQDYYFHMEPSDFADSSTTFRLRICQFAVDQVVAEREWATTPAYSPDYIYVRLNNRRKHLPGKTLYKSGWPREMCGVVTTGVNHMEVFYNPKDISNDGEEAIGYYLGIEMTTVATHDWIISMIDSFPHIDRRETIGNICQILDPSEENELGDPQLVTQHTIAVDISDPISNTLINTPVRGIDCQHLSCFDLEVHLGQHVWESDQQQGREEEWICPICRSDARPQSLRIDDFFSDLGHELAEIGLGDVHRVLLNGEGTWFLMNGESLHLEDYENQQSVMMI